MSILRNVMTCSMLTAAILAGAAAMTSASAANYSYGGVKYLTNTPVYTFGPKGSQNGNVVFFGAAPTTYPSHSGQYGNVTYLGGAKPYTYRGHNGQYGNVTYINYRPTGTVPIPTIRTPNIIRIR
jgi:hypothetical protein